MESALMTGRMAAVPDIDPMQSRIEALTEELDRHPEITIDRLAKAARYSYQTWRNLVTGKSRKMKTLEAFEEALEFLIAHPDDVEEEPAHVAVVAPSPDDLIEVEISGDFGVRVVVRAPVADEEALREFARSLIREMRTKPED